MKTKILLCFLLFITSCTYLPSVPALITKETTHYPNVPLLDLPPPIILLPVEFDWPRNDSLVVKNSKVCNSVKTNKDSAFWRKCGVKQVDLSSNLFIGLDKKNYENLTINFKRIVAREEEWRQRIRIVNKQRQLWRDKNEKGKQ